MVATATGAALVGLMTVGIPSAAQAAPAAASVQSARAAIATRLDSDDGPEIKLIVAQKHITVDRYGKSPVFLDPGVYVAALNSPLRLDVARSYGKPLTITQVIKTPAGNVYRRLPHSTLDIWNGLLRFAHYRITNRAGKLFGQGSITFCPSGYQEARSNPNSAPTDPYPLGCYSFDPFVVGAVWGLPRGWASDPGLPKAFKMPVGHYKLVEQVNPLYLRLFHISSRHATAVVRIKVVKGKACGCPGCCPPVPPAGFIKVNRTAPGAQQHGSEARLPDVKVMNHPPADALPDLIPLPSWGIEAYHVKHHGDFLNFGATVWISGNAPLDVEGFRTSNSNTMQAWQYFYRHGHIIGRAHVGTMGFANYNSWHFKQFAQYKLLNSRKHVVVSSRKVGFCIAPTDAVDMLLHDATWQPSYTGISGNCGQVGALWVTETLPLGWGDTYVQSVPYQSFAISKIPNGTYYIEIIANPEHLLHETNTGNDVSLRKVIISGTPGHRHVTVPPWHGLDPER
jgi:hypothetical protein